MASTLVLEGIGVILDYTLDYGAAPAEPVSRQGPFAGIGRLADWGSAVSGRPGGASRAVARKAAMRPIDGKPRGVTAQAKANPALFSFRALAHFVRPVRKKDAEAGFVREEN